MSAIDETHDPNRRDFLYIATGMAGVVGAAAFAWPFIDQMRPDASTLALASVEVDVSSLQPGSSLIVKWRGKPVVVRNRTGFTEARNMRRIEQALTELSKRVGFRVTGGLSERVIYRELFPSGLTLLDKGHLGELGTSHLVARQELRQLIAGLNLPTPAQRQKELAPAEPAWKMFLPIFSR